MNDADLAYLAGVLDTRAVVRTRYAPRPNTLLPHLGLASGDLTLQHWLGALTGVQTTLTTRGCPEHCTGTHEHVRLTTGRWSLTGGRATVVLCATRPYIRFQEAAWDRSIGAGVAAPHHETTATTMAALGWPLPVAWTAL